MTKKSETAYQQLPFVAVVGHSLVKQAFLLLAVEPRLGGLALAAGPGTAKTTLARSFHDLLPLQSAIAGCPSHCNPALPAKWCSECRGKYSHSNQPPEVCQIYPPFINLPLNVSQDRLLGGLSLEATLQHGRRMAERGLLAEANRGLLYCDELNLLENNVSNYLLDSLSRGRLLLEREGLSDEYPTELTLIGTFNPREGTLQPGLLDRIGLIVAASEPVEPENRVEIMRRSLFFDRQDRQTLEQNTAFAAETEHLRQQILNGRELLPQVQIGDEQLLALAGIAERLGVPGNRADILAARAACGAAALAGRLLVQDEDLKLAIQLVLVPRATRQPEPEQQESEQKQEEQEEQKEQPQPAESNQQPEQSQSENENENENEISPEQDQQPEDLLFAALETHLPSDILALAQARQMRAKSGSRGATYNQKRGRHIRSVAAKAGQGRIAILDTLRAAAPFQAMRGRLPESAATALSETTPLQPLPKKPVQIRATDLRIKQFKDKAGVLFIFLVDASGSMALNRMREAKGAVTQLLQQAYVHRDKVALVAFRGRAAEILLPPSQSVELAKHSLDVLPVGGGTPLAAALLTGLNLSQQAQRQGISKTMLVLITDGRGNVLLNEDANSGALSKETRKHQAAQEVQKLALAINTAGLATVVLDTQANFLSKNDATQLARTLGGRYNYLPRADARTIADNVVKAAEILR